MSVSFDVLDSLYSIRNVEDLKKHWTEDSKRPQTSSYKAVELFNSYFHNDSLDSGDFIICVAQFAMCYRLAVCKKLCSEQEQLWIMPYVRYAEGLKAFIVHGDITSIDTDEFVLRMRDDFIENYAYYNEHVEIFEKIANQLPDLKKNGFTDVKQCEEIVQLFERLRRIIENNHGPDDYRFWWLAGMYYPHNISNSYLKNNPWDLLLDPENDDIYMRDEVPFEFGSVSPFYDSELAYDNNSYPDTMGHNWIAMLKNSSQDRLSAIQKALSIGDIDVTLDLAGFVNKIPSEEFSEVRKLLKDKFGHVDCEDDSVKNIIHVITAFMFMEDERLVEIQKAFNGCNSLKEIYQLADLPHLVFMFEKYVGNTLICLKDIEKIINNNGLPAQEKLEQISFFPSRIPWHFKIKIQYQLENIFVKYMKELLPKELQSSDVKVRRTLDLVTEYKKLLPYDFFNYLYESLMKCLEVAEIRMQERKKVLFEMSHSIKNLVATISDPLTMLQAELNDKQRRIIENALSGTELIRDLAVGVHMSMRGENGAWRKDVQEPGFGAMTLDKIILDAMRHAISNMFDGKYFAQFVRNYFGRDLDTFMQAQNDWKAAQTAEQVFDCINKYFFDFKIDCHDTDMKIPVGDRDGTATKLLILFQELFLNAVKYSSFAESDKRFVKVDITITADKWNIEISNSAIDRKNVKSSGIGLAVIKNFAELFEATYNARLDSDVYTATMKFFLNK